MKLKPADLVGALRAVPTGFGAVVVFGPELALVRERRKVFARQYVADLKDPFAVTTFSMADVTAQPSRLPDEAAAFSFTGGRRVIFVEEATDAIVPALSATLAQPSTVAMLIITAGDLPPSSALRTYAESSPVVLAVACYAESAATLSAMLKQEAAAQGYRLETDAAALILEASGNERDVARQELEKLMLFVGQDRTVLTHNDVIDIGADRGAAAMEDLVAAICHGQSQKAEKQMHQLLDSGAQGISLMRAVSRRLWLLASAHASLEEGKSQKAIADRLFGRMAWKEAEPFARQLALWPRSRVEAGLNRLASAERACKHNSARAEVIVARALLALSMVSKDH